MTKEYKKLIKENPKMIIEVGTINNIFLRRVVKHVIFLLIIFILLPYFSYFELFVVLPVLVKKWSLSYFIHVACGLFLLLNIVGNMIFGMFTNTSIKGKIVNTSNRSDWTFCVVCESKRPLRAWHCDICNTCILKRDHHCPFFACCIGYFNHRYFMLFTFDLFVAMIYAFYFNVQFLAQFITWNHGFIIVKFIFPLASFVLDFGYESIYVFLVVLNVIIGIFSGFMFIYHFKNILQGKTAPEIKYCNKDCLYNRGWKLNLIEVFGVRWYLTWILPFINSPLPGNGIDWIVDDKQN